MTPAERIKQLVDNNDLTYIELEKKTGISKSVLQRYATGNTKKIPVEAVEAIAKAYGVSPAYIMGWEDDEPATGSETKEAPALTEEDGRVKEFVDLFQRLTTEQQALVIAQIKGILSSR